jgi:RNA-directed DNA polymerase
MRPPPSDRADIILLVEESHLPASLTLEVLGIARSSFNRWYDHYQSDGPEALADGPSRPDRVWNRIPDEMRTQIIEMTLDCSELSPRELAVRFTDEKRNFVSDASVYRLLKSQYLITRPAYIVIKAADQFRARTTASNQLWQTQFTYLKITGWAGIICRSSWTTTRAISSPGSSA